MKNEEEIRKKRDFLKSLIETSNEDVVLGTISKRKLNQKVALLNWVLDEENINSHQLKAKLNVPKVVEDTKAKILSLLEENKDNVFNSFELSEKLGIRIVLIRRVLNLLRKENLISFTLKDKGLGNRNTIYYSFKGEEINYD